MKRHHMSNLKDIALNLTNNKNFQPFENVRIKINKDKQSVIQHHVDQVIQV